MKNTVVLILGILAFSLNSKAQGAGSEKDFKHGIGFAVGGTIGNGISYRYTPGTLKLQVGFAPFKSDYETRISAGIAIIYTLVEVKNVDFFLYQANRITRTKNEDYYYDSFRTNQDKQEHKTTSSNHGIGMGFEAKAGSRVSFVFMAGYGAFDNFETINITGELGCFFKL
jgi:hypothetical protein